MSWVKLDDQFPEHPKVLKAGPPAAWLYVCGLAYSSRQLTDGFIPEQAVGRLVDGKQAKALAMKLVEVGLWEAVDGGFNIHDYHDFQPSSDQVRRNRASNAARQESLRARRNGVTEALLSPHSNAVTNGVTDALVTRESRPSRARNTPGPYPDPGSEQIVTPGNTPVASGGAGGSGGADAPLKPSKAKPRGSRAPDGFELTEAHYDRAAEYGVPLDRVDAETTRFLDHHRAKGTVFQDWQAAWRTWMQRAAEYAVRPVPIRGGRSVNQATEWIDDKTPEARAAIERWANGQ